MLKPLAPPWLPWGAVSDLCGDIKAPCIPCPVNLYPLWEQRPQLSVYTRLCDLVGFVHHWPLRPFPPCLMGKRDPTAPLSRCCSCHRSLCIGPQSSAVKPRGLSQGLGPLLPACHLSSFIPRSDVLRPEQTACLSAQMLCDPVSRPPRPHC